MNDELIATMLSAYLDSIDSWYKGNEYRNIEIKGDEIHFLSTSPCGNYRDKESVSLLNLITWIWSKTNE